MDTRNFARLIAGTILSAVAAVSNAGLISWTNWTVDAVGTTGSAHGTILQNGVTVDVNYTGDLGGFAPASWWSEGSPAPYTGNSVIDNAPTSGLMVYRTSFGNTLTFSSALLDPVFALYSVGQYGVPVSYAFDQSFTLLSEGYGHWGDGSFTTSGNTLTGREGHGAIQFSGPVSSISWNILNPEYHHGFTVGALTEVATEEVPEPSSLALLGLGLIGVSLARRKVAKAS